MLGSGDAPRERAAEIDRRLRLIGTVYRANADVPLLELDYLPDGDAGTRLDLSTVDESDRGLVLDTVKAMSRTQRVTGLASDTARLMAAGYGSAAALSVADPAQVAERAGLDGSTASRYVLRAREAAGGAALSMFAAADLARLPGKGTHVLGPAPVAIGDWFTRIPGYAELFGDTAFCVCRHCRSVLSPAAYFVDLMWFVPDTADRQGVRGPPASIRCGCKADAPTCGA